MPIPVTDLISTTSPTDTYATHDSSLGKGGHQSVESYNDMLLITPERRTGGMQVHVRETDKLYKLNPSSQNWKTISSSVVITGSTLLDQLPNKTVGMFAFAADTNVMYQLEDDLVTWTAQDSTIPSFYIKTVATLTDRNNLIESDRYLNMIVKVNSDSSYYRLQGFSYNSAGQFINNDFDWVSLNFDEDLFVVDNLLDLTGIAPAEFWPGRKVFVINETLYVELSRSGNEWSEIPINEVPYYIISSQSDFFTVPSFYRRSGLLVFVEDETKLYTRNLDNTAWVAVTADSIPGDSAYQVAVNNGFVGTEQEWLNSLVGRGITATILSPTGDLEIEYTDGTIVNVGTVRGDKGDDGVSVVNIELYDDPLSPGTVYFITELSDGRVLQTQNAISGYNGASIADMYIENNLIYVTLSDGSMLSPVPVTGLTPISIVDVRIENGDLIIEYSNGVTESAGSAENLQGRGLLQVALQEGLLKVEWTDDPGVLETIGTVNSVVNMQVIDGELFVTYATDTSTPVKLTDLVGITGAYLNVNDELVFTTTRDAPNNEINIGPVANIKGETGESVQSVSLVGNDLIFTLTDGTVLDPIPVTGLTPISIDSARIENGDLIFGLTNGSEINAGLVDDLQGRGISQTSIVNGQLYVYYDDDPLVSVLVGDVPGIASTTLTGGELFVSYTTAPAVQVKVGDINTLESAVIINGILTFTYSNGTTEDVGLIRSIVSMTVTPEGDLSVVYSDGTSGDLGNILGPQGPRGYNITGATVNTGGFLEVFTNDPENPVYQAGFVRTTIQNLIGQTPLFEANSGQTDFLVEHDSVNVIVFVNGVMLSPDQYNLDTPDRVVLLTPATAGDDVRIITYVAGGPSLTGRGIFNVLEDNGVYTITLEDGSPIIIDTNTPVDPTTLPPGIDNIVVQPNGDIQVFLTDGTNFIAGSANNAVNITSAEVDANGDLLIYTTDVANSPINAGSVLSGLQIQSAEVDVNGHLIFTTTGGTTFDAGPAANYVTGANITPVGELILNMSIGNDINAGSVRNPLLGMISDTIAFAGQTEFVAEHNGYDVVVYANGVALSKDRVDLTDPTKVVLLDPRESGDIVKIMMLYTATVSATTIAGADLAENNTYYGKDNEGNLGFLPVTNIKISQPFDFIATAGQIDFFVNHNGVVEVIKNGIYLMSTQYTFPNFSRVRLTVPANAGDNIRINVLAAPVATDGLTFDNYVRFKYLTNVGGGAALRGAWRPRAINTIATSTIAGTAIDRSNMILPAGTYYIRGWAAANSVGAHAIRLYNVTGNDELLVGESVFSGQYPNNDSYQNLNAPQIPNSHAPIDGYFTLSVQSAIQLQHRVLVDRFVNSGFGAVGSGFAAISAPSTGSAPGTSNVLQEGLGMPATLIDMQIWRVG